MTKMTETETGYIIVGKIGATYGVRGWLKIQSFTELSATILDYTPWYLSKDQQSWQAITVADTQIQGTSILAKFANIDTPESARLLTGQLIAVKRSQLAALDPGEYYWSDLKGLTVINKNGDILGKVSYLMETGANDVLVIKGDKSHAIPYLPGRVVLKVDLEKQEIHVDWDPI